MDRLITGTPGDDTLAGGDGDERIKGLAGDDVIDGGNGNDELIGNEGNDVLRGGRGADRLFGCEDDDVLDGGAGADLINAGSGRDTLIFTAAENTGPGFDYYDGHNGIDRLVLVLTQAEFEAARADIAAFQAFIDATTGATGESGGRTTAETGATDAGPFFFFASLNLAARRIERLQVIVDDEVVIGADTRAVDDAAAIDADAVLQGSVADNDVADGEVVYSLVSAPEGGAFTFGADGRYTFKPGEGFIGLAAGEAATRSFTYAVTDGFGTRSEAVATLTIRGVNDPVDAGADLSEARDDTDEAFTIDLLAGVSDPDQSDQPFVQSVQTLSGDDSGIGEPDAQGVITVDPAAYEALAAGETETVRLRITVSDGNGSTDTRDLTIVINGTSDNAPPAEDDALSGAFAEDAVIADTGDTVFSLDLLAGVSDPDGDALSVGSVELSGFLGGDFLSETQGRFLLIPTNQAAFQGLAQGETVTIDVGFEVSDGVNDPVARTGTITLTGTNDAPTSALEDSASEDAASFTVNLLSDAFDIDGDEVTLVEDSVSMKPIKGRTTYIGEGTSLPQNFTRDGNTVTVNLEAFQYLAAGETDTLTIAYRITDGIATVPVTAELTIVGANDAPRVEGPLSFTVSEDEAGRLLDLLQGASDIDRSDVLSVAGLDPAEGLSQQGNELRVDAAAFEGLNEGQSRTVVLEYTVSDGNGGTAAQTATVVLEGRGGNAAQDDAGAVDVGATLSADVSANDTVPEGTTFSLVSDVARGTLEFSEDGTFVFDPGTDFRLANGATAQETFTYAFETPAGDTGTATVTLTVTGTNTVPQVNGSFGSGGENSARDQAILPLLPSDPDGPDPLELSNFVITDSLGSDIPSDAVRVEDGRFIYGGEFYDFLNDGEDVVVTLSFDVFDGLDTATSTLQLFLSGVEDTPMLINDAPLSVTIGEGDAPVDLTALVLANVTDADQGDNALLSIVGVTGSGTATPPEGTSLDMGTLLFDPSSYADDLPAGQSITLTLVAVVDDDFSQGTANSSAAQFVEVTIVGADPDNSAPVVGPSPAGSFFEDDELSQPTGPSAQIFTLNLLSGSTDPDGDALSVQNLSVSVAGTTEVLGTDEYTVDEDGRLRIATDLARFQPLNTGDQLELQLSYDVSDGNGGLSAQTGTIVVDGVNDDPDANGGPLVDPVTEDQPELLVIDLLDGVSDVDNPPEEIIVDDISATLEIPSRSAGLPPGVTPVPILVDFELENGVFTLDPAQEAFQGIPAGEIAELLIQYGVADADGGFDFVELVVEVTGVNDAPESTGAIVIEVNESDSPLTVDVLQNAFDVDFGDVLSFEGLTTTVSGDDAGILTSFGFFQIDPSAYASLNAGDTEVIVIDAEISDGNGGTVQQRIEITVVGEGSAANQPPGNFTDGVTLGDAFIALEGSAGVLTDSVDNPISDPEGGPLSFLSLLAPLPPGITLDPDTLVVTFDASDPAFDALRAGEVFDGEFFLEVADEAGGRTDVRGTFTVIGTNDAPVVEGPLSATLSPFGSSDFVNLLEGASDADAGDVLRVANVQGLPDGSFLSVETGELFLDTFFALRPFAEGEAAEFVITYDIVDAFGGSVAQTLTLNGTGVNDFPVIEESFEIWLSAFVDNGQAELPTGPGPFSNVTAVGAEPALRTIDLGRLASDPDGDALRVVSVDIPPLLEFYAFFDEDTGELTIDTIELGIDAPTQVSIGYTVEDPFGAQATGTVLVNLFDLEFETDSNPVTDGDLVLSFTEDDVPATIDLFQGITDPDGTLAIEFVDGISPFLVDDATGELRLAASYDFLNAGDSVVIAFSYSVADQLGGHVERNAEITINGINDAPEDRLDNVVIPLSPSDGVQLIDLLEDDLDPDDAALDFALAPGTDSAFSIVGNRYLRFDGTDSQFGRFAELAAGETDTFELTITYTDSGGLTGTTRVTFEVVGENDAPVEVAPPRFFDNSVAFYQFSGGQQNFEIDAWEVFQDADLGGFDERFLDVTLESGDPSILFEVVDGRLVIDPASFADLEPGARADFTFAYSGVTGDGDTISGTFDYRVEGTAPPPSFAESKPDIAVFEPVRTVEGVEGDATPPAVIPDDLDTAGSWWVDFPGAADTAAATVAGGFGGFIHIDTDPFGGRYLVDEGVDDFA